MSQSYSVYETKAKLSELLRKVKSGESIVVTERGQPIATLIPFSKPSSIKQLIAELETSGNIISAKPSNGKKFLTYPRPGGLKRFLQDR